MLSREEGEALNGGRSKTGFEVVILTTTRSNYVRDESTDNQVQHSAK